MKKNLLAVATMLLSSFAGFAQEVPGMDADEFQWIEVANASSEKSSVVLTDEAVAEFISGWWSYGDPTPLQYGGWSSPETYIVGIYLPDSLAGYQLDSIRFALGTDTGIENLRIWANMGLAEFQDLEVVEATKKAPVKYQTAGGWNTAAFSEPLLIEPPKNKWTKFAVGFAFDQTVSGALYPLAFTKSDPDYSFWIYGTKNSGGWMSVAYAWGAYSMAVHVSKPGATDIHNTLTQTAPVPVGYYSVDGRRQEGLCPGINIVKYSDGSSRRIIHNR